MSDPRFEPETRYPRFKKSDRVQHLLMLVSFLVLTVTGLPQKYIYLNNHYLDDLIDLMGGLETVRVVHRWAATVLMLVTVYHLLAVAHRTLVRRVSLSMLPRYQDVVHAWQAVRYNLGLEKARPRMDRFTWEEKLEYWSLIWGTIVMIATGFMLWNPIATARFLPGQWIPAAQVVHGGEALLAILAVLVWHFYAVHLRSFNRSMFTGHMSEAEMEHEHPLELERLKAGASGPESDPAGLARRQRIYLPVASLVAALLLAGIFWFVTFEQTAIETLPPAQGDQGARR
jgi:formate dehydrogenase gamma subunit